MVMIQTNNFAQEKFHDEELQVVASLGEYQAIGVGVSSDNRVFVSFPNRGGAYKHALTEIKNGEPVPYPNLDWNKDSKEGNSNFASVQDIFVDADDNLWVLDSKPAPGGSIFGNSEGEKAKEGYFKLVKINTKTDKVEKIYNLNDLDKKRSGLNDVRIDTRRNLAYFSDPGMAAIVILDLKTEKTRVVLQKTEFTLAKPEIVLSYNGNEMRNPEGKPFRSNVNGIALTHDFEYFYFKPINHTHLFRIKTEFLTDKSLSDKSLAQKVEDMGEVGVTHGLEADKKGNVYLTTSLDYTVKYLTHEGELKTLTQDSRLLWPDSLGVGTDGYLYFSCAQMQLEAQWNDGQSKLELPFKIFRYKLP